MAFRANGRWATRTAIFLVSTAFPIALAGTDPASAQANRSIVSASEQVNFSIPSQSLASALNAFARVTGWQLGYQSAMTAGRQSTAIAGNYAPVAALQAILSGTGITVRVTGAGTVSLIEASAAQTNSADGSTVLETITVKSARSGIALGTSSVADTGTSTISGGQIAARVEGNDANGILRNLPNIQYQNDVSEDAGVTDLSVIDLRPREVSIAGARVYENNFILNGIGINDVTGSQEGYGSENMEDGLSPLNEARMFGLHSQTVYVPGDFVSETTVIDSNASAKYGNFQGGVVSYKLADASRDRLEGSVTSEYTTSDWAGYHIATLTGLNPNSVAQQEYLKRRISTSLSGPVNNNIAVLGQYSKETALTHKAKWPRYTEKNEVEEDSGNEFYRGQIIADTDAGIFTLEGFYTDYNQSWENAGWRNAVMNLAKDTFTAKLQHDYEFEDFNLGGIDISNAKLTSKLTYGRSKSINDANGNVGRAFTQSLATRGVVRWEAQTLSDWCRTDTSISGNTLCYDGALGDKYQAQEQTSLAQEFTADVGAGSLKLGADYTNTEASRTRPEDVTYYTVYQTLGAVSGLSGFVCNTTNECNSEMYASNKTIYPAFDIRANLNEFNTYAEIDQNFDWFNIRAGARVSYNDYMKNVDIAPRLVGTIKPWDDFSISAGFNRYYNAATLAYAIRALQPRPVNYTRTRSGAVVDDTWAIRPANAPYTSSAADLDTPYNDEISLSVAGKDPLLDGDFRLRYLHRAAKDQFATEGSSPNYTLTNDGTGGYQSATAEYSKEFDTSAVARLDNLSFNTSITWSKKKVSNNSYYEDDFEDEYILYNNTSYTKAGFNVVTGNMDIPLRWQAGISTAWLDNRVFIDVSGNYNFAYKGVRATDDSTVIDGVMHEIWEDYDFDQTFTVDLSARFVVYEKDYANFSLNLKVLNLFDEAGNAKANTSAPWVIGRTVWVGAKAAF
jgi:hypothetical protein